MRAFPLQDEDHVVQDISEQLRDLIQSGQGLYMPYDKINFYYAK